MRSALHITFSNIRISKFKAKRLNYLHSLKLHTRETVAVNKPYALLSIHRAAV